MKNLLSNYPGQGMSKIDLHVHYLPESYLEALLHCGEKNPDGFPTPDWNPKQHLEVMQHLGIQTSMLSLSSPHINFGDRNATRVLARRANEAGAELVGRYPQQFGLLASLPLPNVEDSIAEIQYAKEVLHADGFALPTNSRGVYLGNPCLDPILAELNRHQAVVVIHPNKPGSIPENVVEGLPIPMMEFLFDTTRTVINLILKGTLRRFPDMKLVIPHAGAFLSILADRVGAAIQMMPAVFGGNIQSGGEPVDVFASLKGLYYDVAGVCLPRQLAALLSIVDADHLLYGSDYPYTSELGCLKLAEALERTDLIGDEQRRMIYRDNALKLFKMRLC